MSLSVFIEKSEKIHFDKYDYSKSIYKGALTKLEIICNKHGTFWQTPSHHINGQGCPKCATENKSKKLRATKETFLEKAYITHGGKYNYLKFKYKNSITKGIIICHEHGEFLQSPDKHVNAGRGCPKCGGSKRKTTRKFIRQAKQVHNNKYDYSEFKYKNAFTKGLITCKIHGRFNQTPDSHLRGSGCPKCYGRISKTEKKWLDEIERNNNIIVKRQKYIYYYTGNSKKYFRIDGFCEETNTCYEYNGYYWHGHPNYYNSNDIHPVIKTKTFGQLYQETLGKEKIIKRAGYNLITKWGE